MTLMQASRAVFVMFVLSSCTKTLATCEDSTCVEDAALHGSALLQTKKSQRSVASHQYPSLELAQSESRYLQASDQCLPAGMRKTHLKMLSKTSVRKTAQIPQPGEACTLYGVAGKYVTDPCGQYGNEPPVCNVGQDDSKCTGESNDAGAPGIACSGDGGLQGQCKMCQLGVWYCELTAPAATTAAPAATTAAPAATTAAPDATTVAPVATTVEPATATTLAPTDSLDAAGFKATTSLCCPEKMEEFFNSLLDKMGFDVCSKPHIQGLMHWFSCVPDMDFQYVLDIINNGNPCKYWAPKGTVCPVLSEECQGKWCR